MKPFSIVTFLGLMGLVLFACTKSKADLKEGFDLSLNNQPSKYTDEEVANDGTGSKRQVFKGLEYRFQIIDAIQFIEQSGQKVDKEDEADLSNESVGILDINSVDGKSIFDLLKDKTKEEGIAYLMLEIISDLRVSQNNASIEIFSNSYDVNALNENGVRIYFFMSKVQNSDGYSVDYYDELFGNGLIKFKKNHDK